MTTRRELLKMSASLPALAALPLGVAAITPPSVFAQSSGPPAFQAYVAASAADHQNSFTSLSSQGYRLLSLCVYGDPANPLYAAVWVQTSGPAWTEVHGVNAADYQSFYNTQTAQGFRPIIVSATGDGAAAIFAAVFDQSPSASWLSLTGLPDGDESDSSTFQGQCSAALQKGLILRSATVYGTASTRQYAAIWETNSPQTNWLCRAVDDAADFQAWLSGLTQVPSRLAYVSVSPDTQYLSVYRDDALGDWVAQADMTASQYQDAFNTQTGQGYLPICVQAGGTGDQARYAAIFGKQVTPTARTWTITGDPSPKLGAIDGAVQAFMQSNGVRAGTLAVAKNGDFVYSRAYTWAEPGYPITQPSTLLRLASVTKAFTAAAIQKSYDMGLLTPQTLAFPTVGITTAALPSQTVDPRVNTITVQDLVNHTGGWDDSVSHFDPTFNLREIAQALGVNGPPTNRDLARYMYGEALQFAPGTGPGAYSNFGYALLGLLIEQVSAKSYADFVQQQVLAPLGITEVAVSPAQASQRLATEGLYHELGAGLTALAPNSSTLLPNAYGGGDFLTDVDVGDGGLAASSHAVVRLIHTWTVWGIGPRSAPGDWVLARTGSQPGTSSLAESRGGDGVDFAFIVNTSDFPPGAGDVMGNLSSGIESLLNATSL